MHELILTLSVLEYNKQVNGQKIGELLLPLAGADIYAQTPATQRADRAIANHFKQCVIVYLA